MGNCEVSFRKSYLNNCYEQLTKLFSEQNGWMNVYDIIGKLREECRYVRIAQVRILIQTMEHKGFDIERKRDRHSRVSFRLRKTVDQK